MKKLDTLSSLEGRKALQEIFQELRYEKQLSSASTLFLCWRICVFEREIHKHVKKDISVLHPLGLFSGTGLWMEEIINRFYFTTINSFVYFGAAVLLVIIGVRRFSDTVSDNLVIAGVAFEALMLIFMFIVMLFTPNEELNYASNKSDGTEELLTEVGEIGRDFAAVVIQLENLSNSLQDVVNKQIQIMGSVEEVAKNSALAVSPNPGMIEAMKETNTALGNFKETVNRLADAAESLRSEEIQMSVRREVERIILDRIPQK